MTLHIGILYALPAFIIWFAYFFILIWRIRKRPLSTSIGTYIKMRSAWVRSVMKYDLGILSVQTLRNWSMSATFLASTASLMALVALNFILEQGTLENVALRHNDIGLSDNEAIQFFRERLLLIMIVLFISFLNFTLSIRYYNKAGFMLCIREKNVIPAQRKYAIRTVQNGALHYQIGMRSYYLAVPLGLWLLSTSWMYVGMILVMMLQYRTDYR